MKRITFGNINIVNKLLLFLSLMVASTLLLSAVPVFADRSNEAEHCKSLSVTSGMMYGMMGQGMMDGLMKDRNAPYKWGMMGPGMMGGLFGSRMMLFSYGGIVMWFIILILIGVVVYLIVRFQKNAGRTEQFSHETPLEIAQKRYASGEITKEEYESIKHNL